MRFLEVFLILLVFAACNSGNNEVLNIPEYDGPVQEIHNVSNYYSDSAVVKLKIEAQVHWIYENGDMEFPEGINLEFYDKFGEVTNTLRADYCEYDAEEKLYLATGNVVMKGLKNNEQLNTEELYWDPEKEIVYTEKFVTIETENQIVKGNGMESDQEFTSWVIKDSQGTISLDD